MAKIKSNLKQNILISNDIDVSKFIDINKYNIIFAGEWCRINNNADIKNYNIVPFQLNNIKEKQTYQKYLINIENIILKYLTKKLNDYNNLNEEEEFYYPIIGYWLINYIHRSFFQFKTIQYAVKTYENLSALVLKNDAYVVPLGSMDTINLNTEEIYNFQNFSEVISFFEINEIEVHLENQLVQKKIYKIHKNTNPNILHELNYYKKKPTVTIVDPYIDSFENIKRIAYGSDKIIFDNFQYSFYSLEMPLIIDHSFRKQDLKIISEDDFILFLSKNILKNIPIIYLEGFCKFKNWINKQHIIKTPIYYSSVGFYSNDFFKFFIAINRKSIKILSHQHGAGYGMDYISFPEYFEKKVSDVFFNFGWEKLNNSKYLPFERIQYKPNKYTANNNIVMILCDRYKYFHNLLSTTISSQAIEEIEFINTFIEKLSTKKLFVRFYMRNLGWNKKELIIKRNKNKVIEDKSDIYNTLYESKLIIMDEIGTSFLQRIAINKPIFILIHPQRIQFRDEFLYFYNELKKIYVIHDNLESALIHFDKIKDNIEKWWMENEVQKVVKKFSYNYARKTYTWHKVFIHELENQSQEIEDEN